MRLLQNLTHAAFHNFSPEMYIGHCFQASTRTSCETFVEKLSHTESGYENIQYFVMFISFRFSGSGVRIPVEARDFSLIRNF